MRRRSIDISRDMKSLMLIMKFRGSGAIPTRSTLD